MQYPKLKPGSKYILPNDAEKILNETPKKLYTYRAAGLDANGTRVQWGSGFKTVYSRLSLKRLYLYRIVKKHFRADKAAQIVNSVLAEDFSKMMIVLNSNPENLVFIDPDESEKLKRLADQETVVVFHLSKIGEAVDRMIIDYYQI